MNIVLAKELREVYKHIFPNAFYPRHNFIEAYEEYKNNGYVSDKLKYGIKIPNELYDIIPYLLGDDNDSMLLPYIKHNKAEVIFQIKKHRKYKTKTNNKGKPYKCKINSKGRNIYVRENNYDFYEISVRYNKMFAIIYKFEKGDCYLYLHSDVYNRIDRDLYTKYLMHIFDQIYENMVKYFSEAGKICKLCMICGRELTDDKSKELGIGPVCNKRVGAISGIEKDDVGMRKFVDQELLTYDYCNKNDVDNFWSSFEDTCKNIEENKEPI